MKVLNFGSLNLDYVYQVDRFVRPGETLAARSLEVKCGGKGLNQSIALARAGAQVSHAGCIGAGGESLKALLEENGVNSVFVMSVPETQGHTVIQVTPEGENCILLFGGSNRCVTPRQIEDTLSRFGPGDYLVLQNEINMLPEIVNRAAERGMRIVLNPSPFDSALQEVDFQKLAWLMVNEIEAEQMTGESDPERAVLALRARYPRLSAVITLGEKGSAAFRADRPELVRQEAFRVRAVDTTAAGDTYTGFLIAGLMENIPLKACMERASRAAALSVTRPGAAASIPWKAEVG